MKCAVVQMESDLTLSGARIYDWMLRTYNREKPLEIFGTIGQIAAMRPIISAALDKPSSVALNFVGISPE